MRALLLGVMTMLAACPLQKTTTLGGGSSPGGGGGDSSAQAAANDPDAEVTVPKVMGMTKEQADAALASAGFTHGVDMYPLTCDDPKPAGGTIECQDPAPGEKVKGRSMVKVSILAVEKHDRMMPSDFKALVGLTVEQAKTKAKQLGHTGQVSVSEAREFIAGCKPDTVCEASGSMGDTMSFADGLILTLNRKLDIGAPPPD